MTILCGNRRIKNNEAFRDSAECIRIDGVVCFMKRHIKTQIGLRHIPMVEPPSFLKTVLAHLSNPDPSSNYPHVTLTFAQSIDAKIAGKNGQQLLLSGKESMIMTHWYVIVFFFFLDEN